MNNLITFFATGKKALNVFLNIESSYYKYIDLIVIGKDKNILNDYADEIESFCIKTGFHYQFSSESINVKSKYILAIGWRRIINKQPNQKLIIFHDSFLPRLRGFNPLVTALINGDHKIGVTALFGIHDYDKGNIIDQVEIPIEYPIKIQQVIELISDCYLELVNRIIKYIQQNKNIHSSPQNEKLATYSLWRDEKDYIIDWKGSAEKIVRFIDAVGYPYLGAKTTILDDIYIIEEAVVVDDLIIENRIPGKVIYTTDDKPVVVCGTGLIKIIKMIDFKTGSSSLPMKKFRIRFE